MMMLRCRFCGAPWHRYHWCGLQALEHRELLGAAMREIRRLKAKR